MNRRNAMVTFAPANVMIAQNAMKARMKKNDLHLPIAHNNLRHWRSGGEVVNKAMNIIEAAKTLKQYCEDCGSSCKGCIFHDEECMMYATLPDEWAIPNPDSISDEIQHVAYDDAQLGREK